MTVGHWRRKYLFWHLQNGTRLNIGIITHVRQWSYKCCRFILSKRKQYPDLIIKMSLPAALLQRLKKRGLVSKQSGK